jgi:hypothetical protein
MTQAPDEIFKSMNITKILLAILENQKVINVPIDIFINAGVEEKGLNVEYNEETKEFVFQLKEKIEQPDDNQDVDAESNT